MFVTQEYVIFLYIDNLLIIIIVYNIQNPDSWKVLFQKKVLILEEPFKEQFCIVFLFYVNIHI